MVMTYPGSTKMKSTAQMQIDAARLAAEQASRLKQDQSQLPAPLAPAGAPSVLQKAVTQGQGAGAQPMMADNTGRLAVPAMPNLTMAAPPTSQGPMLSNNGGPGPIAFGPPGGGGVPNFGNLGGNGGLQMPSTAGLGQPPTYNPLPGQGPGQGLTSGTGDAGFRGNGMSLPPGVGANLGNFNLASPDQDQLINNAINDLLQGKVNARDTSGDEKLIQQQLAASVGQGQADLNARMAAAGFGTSGALAAQGGDMRAQAARQAAEAMMGVREQARQDAEQQALAGLGAAQGQEGLANQATAYANQLALLQAMFGNQPPPAQTPPPQGPTGANANPINTLTGGNSGGRIGDNTDNNLHQAPGATVGNWTLQTYQYGQGVWKNSKTGAIYIGNSPDSKSDVGNQNGSVKDGGPENPRPPGS